MNSYSDSDVFDSDISMIMPMEPSDVVDDLVGDELDEVGHD